LPVAFDCIDANALLHRLRENFHALQHASAQAR
jgi:hypothetical protein